MMKGGLAIHGCGDMKIDLLCDQGGTRNTLDELLS